MRYASHYISQFVSGSEHFAQEKKVISTAGVVEITV